jgi:hypothetical protein
MPLSYHNVDIFKIDKPDRYTQMLEDNNCVINDTLLAFRLYSLLDSNNDFERYLNDFIYYLPLKKHANYDIVIRTDDYSIKEYIILDNFNSINKCIEVAGSYGDGPYSYDKFSILRNDSLITYMITTTYFLDEVADTVLNIPPHIDTTINVQCWVNAPLKSKKGNKK